MKIISDFFKRNNQDPRFLWFIVYYVFYLIGFFWIESFPVDESFHLLYSPLDDHIPFCEYFVIPYFTWFVYFPGIWAYLLFYDQKTFLPYTIALFTGMTFFIIFSRIYPNYISLRVEFDHEKNIFTRICAFLQNIDTPTNVLPSIHVFNSVISHVGLRRSKAGKKAWVRITSFIVMSMICIATLFLRQHSVIDFIGGLILFAVLYLAVYIIWPAAAKKRAA